MTTEEIRARLARPAVEFGTGGFRPGNVATESWVGAVHLYAADEGLPLDEQGRPMWPLLQLVLPGLPLVPASLAATRVLTVFVSQDLPMDLAPNGRNWLLREYAHTQVLVGKQLLNPASPFRPFPLRPRLIEQDFPVWDGGGVPDELADEILALENDGVIDSYYDLVENHHGHKLGGYPTFCQSGIEFSPGFEFVLQIASDAKAHLNIVDGGTVFLAKNAATGEWEFYCDFS